MNANVDHIFHALADKNDSTIITEDSLKEFYMKNNNDKTNFHEFNIKKSILNFTKETDDIINSEMNDNNDTNSSSNNDCINEIIFKKGLYNIMNKINKSNDKDLIMLELESYYMQFIHEYHHDIIELLGLPAEINAIELEALLKR